MIIPDNIIANVPKNNIPLLNIINDNTAVNTNATKTNTNENAIQNTMNLMKTKIIQNTLE